MQLILPKLFFLVASKMTRELLVHNAQRVFANALCLYLCNGIEGSQNPLTPSHAKLLAYYFICAIISVSANTLHVYLSQGGKYILYSFPVKSIKFLSFCCSTIHKVSLPMHYVYIQMIVINTDEKVLYRGIQNYLHVAFHIPYEAS